MLHKGEQISRTVNPTKEETTQNIFPHLIDILFVLFIKFSGAHSGSYFLTRAISDLRLHPTSYSLNLFFSLSLLISCLHPTLFQPVSISYKKERFEWSVSLNKLISLNTVCHVRVSMDTIWASQHPSLLHHSLNEANRIRKKNCSITKMIFF